MKCNKCLTNENYIKIHHHQYKIKDKQVEFDSERRFCSKCNNLVYDSELDNNASKIAISSYNVVKKYRNYIIRGEKCS